MNIDAPGSSPDVAVKREPQTPDPQPSDSKQALRGLKGAFVTLWWRFFDWLALVSWKTLLLVAVLGMIVAAMLKFPEAFILIVLASIIIKIVAGGKRRAELTASEATRRAETEQLERSLIEARMEALQAQIEPHFLFNTLAHVRRLYQFDRAAGARMLRNLKAYLAIALPDMRRTESTLAREIAHVTAYLEIQQIRMGHRLAFAIDVPPALRGARMPPLMLLTLVENAIKHGLSPSPQGGRIDVRASLDDGRLRVAIADTGVGFLKSEGGGTGLANIRARLAAQYGNVSSFALARNEPQGIVAILFVPYEDVSPARASA
jgi:signal transduction histidine kinase